jgi:hypothetical protein
VRRPVLALAGLLLVTACSAGADKPEAPDGLDGLEVFDVKEKTTAERHTAGPVASYARTPPAGGVHWPAQAGGVLGWLRCGVYTEQPPSEFAVHSQEHGAVWLTYRPGASAADVAAFATHAEVRPDYVIVSPFAGQPGAWTASTWGAQLSVDRPDDARLERFVQTYAGGGQGGEKGADCAGGTTPEQARAALAAAVRASPSASPRGAATAP